MGVTHLPYLITIFILLNNNHVTSLHTSFCIRLPLEDATYSVTGDGTVTSVGIEKFPQNIWMPYFWDRESPADKLPYPPTTTYFLRAPELKFKMHLYSLQGRVFGSIEPLSGWFRVSLELNLEGGMAALFKSLILMATDEQMNPVGEFIYGFPRPDQTDCEPNDATKYMLIPCGGVGKNEAFASNVVLWARNDTKRDGIIFPQKYKEYWPIVPDIGSRGILNFYFRMSTQDSNRNKKKRVTFRAIADPDETYTFSRLTSLIPSYYNITLMSATAWFEVAEGAVPGAADPLPTDPEDVTCMEKLYYFRREGLVPDDMPKDRGWHWYMHGYYANPDDELGTLSFEPGTGMRYVRANTVLSYTGCLSKNHFGGRCNFSYCLQTATPLAARTRPVPAPGLVPIVHSKTTASCPSGATCQEYMGSPTIAFCEGEIHDEPKLFNNNVTTFRGVLEEYKAVQGGTNCKKTEDEANAINVTVIRYKKTKTIIKTSNQTSVETETPNPNQTNPFSGNRALVDQRGVRTLGYGTILYSVRKGHGVMMSIISLFCLPISIFASRYYKETFMETRILYSRPWFQIHVQLVFWMFGFYIAGILIALVGRGFIGVSLTSAGLAHRLFGWLGFLLFLFVGFTGGIRTFQEPGRTCSIAAHWLLGYLVYVLNIVSIITSVYIPGSPAADDDASTTHSDGTIINKIYIALAFWLVYETAMHIGMTVLIYLYDRWMQVEEPRKFIPPVIGVPIPVLKENTTEDASGHGMRLIVLCSYVGIAGLMTAGAVGSILLNKPQPNLGFGPMSCTHEWSEKSNRYSMMSKVASSCGP